VKKKVICWILLLLWAGVIFYFSAQPATESDNSSISFSYRFFSMFGFFTMLSESGKMEFIQRFHSLIRTLAHFSIFGVFGALLSMLVKCYTEKILRVFKLSVLISLLYAVSDECHQIFVPGRTFQFSDVVVDILGATLGCGFICIILAVIKAFKNIKNKIVKEADI